MECVSCWYWCGCCRLAAGSDTGDSDNGGDGGGAPPCGGGCGDDDCWAVGAAAATAVGRRLSRLIP